MIVRLALLSALLAAATLHAQDAATADYLTDYLRTQAPRVKGDPHTFAMLVQPYAPLDLQVTNQSVADAQKAKDRFLGAAVHASGVSLDTVLSIDNSFHCETCAATRQDQFKRDLPGIRVLVQEFEKHPAALHLVARWGTPGDFRVNHIFHVGTRTQAYAEVAGFFPAQPGRTYPTEATALAGSGITPLELHKLLVDMAALHIIALVRTSDGVRALRSGISHTEAGLLFVSNPAFTPEPRDEDNGIRITGFVPIADKVYYFES